MRDSQKKRKVDFVSKASRREEKLALCFTLICAASNFCPAEKKDQILSPIFRACFLSRILREGPGKRGRQVRSSSLVLASSICCRPSHYRNKTCLRNWLASCFGCCCLHNQSCKGRTTQLLYYTFTCTYYEQLTRHF